MDQTGLNSGCITQFLETNYQKKNQTNKQGTQSIKRLEKGTEGEEGIFCETGGPTLGKQTLQETQQLLVRVNTGWRRASQEHGISRQRSECMPAAHAQLSIHPSIHLTIHPYPSMLHHSQPRTEPASCVRAHLGTVHVCSRRRGLARNHSWASRAFANRLA